jgi:hypothetical protein
MTDTAINRRLTVDIPNEQYDALYRLVPWGLRRSLIVRILDQLIPLLEKDHTLVLDGIFSGRLILAVNDKEVMNES